MGFRVSAPSTDPSGKSLSISNEVHSTWVDRATFSSKSGVPAPKGMTAPTGVATRNSQLWCMVLTFPTSSFTLYVGTPSVNLWTTAYSVSLHQSLTFHFPWYASFFISTMSPSTNCMVSWFYHSTVFVFQPCNSFGGEPQYNPPSSIF